MSFDAHRANVHLEADQITLGNRQDKNTSHIDIYTTGTLDENDIYLKTSNLMLDSNASIGWNGVKMVTSDGSNLNFTVKPLTNQINSINYSGQTLEHELDALATSIATKLNSTGYTANRMVITSGAGNITTGDAS